MQTNNANTDSTGSSGSSLTAGSSPRWPVVLDSHQQCKESYLTWSASDHVPLDIDKMASAGWCNIGDGHVKTCCCGIDLKWKVNDDPILQHAIHGPTCSFLKQFKSQAYIDGVQADAFSSNEGREQESDQSDVQMSPQQEEKRTLLEEHTRLTKESMCSVCGDEPRETCYLPCGHFACCQTCSPAQLKCPICGKTIEGKIKAFL